MQWTAPGSHCRLALPFRTTVHCSRSPAPIVANVQTKRRCLASVNVPWISSSSDGPLLLFLCALPVALERLEYFLEFSTRSFFKKQKFKGKLNFQRFSGTSYLNTSLNSFGFYVIYRKSVTPAERAVNKLQRERFEAGWNLKTSLCLALFGMSKHDNIEMQK